MLLAEFGGEWNVNVCGCRAASRLACKVLLPPFDAPAAAAAAEDAGPFMATA